jgi:superfamily II DNA/RNA helicase
MPYQIEDYVHRIGRTGRAGKKGKAISMFTKKNFMLAPALIDLMGEAEIPPQLYTLAEFAAKVGGEAKRRWRPVAQAVRNVVKVSDIIKRKRE